MEQENNTQNTNSNQANQYFQKQDLPSATGTLVLGIISISSFWCYGIVGIITGIIALSISHNSNKLYKANPDKYTESSYKNLNAGRITAIVGISLSSIFVVIIFLYILAVSTFFSNILPFAN
jgi:hypothetical protein